MLQGPLHAPFFGLILFTETRPSQMNPGMPDIGVFPLFILRSVSDLRTFLWELVSGSWYFLDWLSLEVRKGYKLVSVKSENTIEMLILTGKDNAFHLLSFVFTDYIHAIVQKTTLQLVVGWDIVLLIYKLCLLRKRKKTHSVLPVTLSLFFNYHHQREKALMPRRTVHMFSTTKKFINV